MSSKNYYDILEISKTSTIDEIKKQYKKLALKWHPDRNKEENAESKFKEISEAYEILSDPEKKQHYDNNINFNHNIQFNNPFDIFEEVFKTNQNIQVFNINPINRQSQTFSINIGGNNIMANSTSTSTSTSIVNGVVTENSTIINNGITTKIIKKNGEIVSKIVTDKNNNILSIFNK